MATTIDRVRYVGAAQLLVDTHNKLVQLYKTSGESGPDRDHMVAMTSFMHDFNRAETLHVIRKNGGKAFILIRRDQET